MLSWIQLRAPKVSIVYNASTARGLDAQPAILEGPSLDCQTIRTTSSPAKGLGGAGHRGNAMHTTQVWRRIGPYLGGFFSFGAVLPCTVVHVA